MELREEVLEKEIFSYVDRVKDLLSPELWQNLLMDCSKNELFVLWFLFRNREVNMTQIAEYINVPLNTATGIIARMEKRALVVRARSAEDKRIVTIQLGDAGKAQIEKITAECLRYGKRIFVEFSKEELEQFVHMADKFMVILQEEQKRQEQKKEKIRKIVIE